MSVTTYKFHHAPSKGNRYSVWARFVTPYGVIPVLEWFSCSLDAITAADAMKADGRFMGVCVYVRDQVTADAS